MKCFIRLLAFLLIIAFTGNVALAKDLAAIKVLYIGTKGSPREEAFATFLKQHVAAVDVAERHGFDPSTVKGYDVVLLDWPQGETGFSEGWAQRLVNPLGPRDAWNHPTVLLGSAGLNVAISWKVKGGIGCTCMDPLAYGLRDHEVFDKPFPIDRGLSVSIRTPVDFRGEIKEPTVTVLPLVDDIHKTWPAGWCTYSDDFAASPDVEYFCGGTNHKTPTAAGLWRQGNLLHFGFEQSPGEMNVTGQRLLLNSIQYISHFSEDRPIAITPSPFAGNVALSRKKFVRWLKDPTELEWLADATAPELYQQLKVKSPPELEAWAKENSKFLHPVDEKNRLAIDDDLRTLGITFDQPEFLDLVVKQLRGDASQQAIGKRLLRYLPDLKESADADTVAKWLDENRPYLFASDSADYRWYIDPLAKKRGVPSSGLRGPRRMDSQ